MNVEGERERLNEGLRLLRAFFRIAEREQRQFVIDVVERAGGRDACASRGERHEVAARRR